MKDHHLYNNFLYDIEADTLLNYLKANVPWTQVKYFKPERGYIVSPRLTWVAGLHSEPSCSSEQIISNAIPELLVPVKALIESHLDTKFNIVLFSCYRNENDSANYNFDLNEHTTTASLILGGSRPLVLKGKSAKTFNLRHGDLFVMKHKPKKKSSYAIPKQAKECLPFYSITFTKSLNIDNCRNYYFYNLGLPIKNSIQ